MNNTNKGFCMFFDWMEDLEYLSAEDAWTVIKALGNYYKNGVDPVENVDKHLKFALSVMFHQIKRQEEISETNRKNISKRKNRSGDSTDCGGLEKSQQDELEVQKNEHLPSADKGSSSNLNKEGEAKTRGETNTNSEVKKDNSELQDGQTNSFSSSENDGSVGFEVACCYNSHYEEQALHDAESERAVESSASSASCKNNREHSELFRMFWEEYPRKVGKARAEKYFMKLKPDKKLVEKMISAVKIQKNTEQWKKANGQFIPHPTTWLERGQWDDVVEIERENTAEVSYGTDNSDFRFNYGELCL